MASEFWGFGLWRFFLLSVCVDVGDSSRYSAPRYPGMLQFLTMTIDKDHLSQPCLILSSVLRFVRPKSCLTEPLSKMSHGGAQDKERLSLDELTMAKLSASPRGYAVHWTADQAVWSCRHHVGNA